MDAVVKDLFVWAIWANLDKQSNHELILLKGHLYLEKTIESAISLNQKNLSKFSFFRKVQIFESELYQPEKDDNLIECLIELNSLRNQMAHEYNFDIMDGRLSIWSQKVLSNFKGEKYSRYTYRTKIVHAFSTLAVNILRSVK